MRPFASCVTLGLLTSLCEQCFKGPMGVVIQCPLRRLLGYNTFLYVQSPAQAECITGDQNVSSLSPPSFLPFLSPSLPEFPLSFPLCPSEKANTQWWDWGRCEINKEHVLSCVNPERLRSHRNQTLLNREVLGGDETQKGWWKVCMKTTGALIFIPSLGRQATASQLAASPPATPMIVM